MIRSWFQQFNWHSWLKGTASTLIIFGATGVSLSPSLAADSAWVYCLFLFGHIVWGVYAIAMKEYSLLWLNVGILPIDLYAIGIRI